MGRGRVQGIHSYYIRTKKLCFRSITVLGGAVEKGMAQQASPWESGDKSHAVHGLRHPLLSFHPMGFVSL